MVNLGDNMYMNKRKYVMKTCLKLVLILAALSITVPAEADLKDDLKSIGLSLLLDKVLNKDDNSKAYPRTRGEEIVREHKVKVDINTQMAQRKLKNCIERGECDSVDFKY